MVVISLHEIVELLDQLLVLNVTCPKRLISILDRLCIINVNIKPTLLMFHYLFVEHLIIKSYSQWRS